MREIKFRAWDTVNGTMAFVETLHLGEKIKTQIENCDWDWYKRDYKLMQYTGLKDVNGREIYDGDIFVKLVSYLNLEIGSTFYEKEYCEVVFHEGKFVVYQDGWGKFDLMDVVNQRHDEADKWESGEVIGNIYENPELITK